MSSPKKTVEQEAADRLADQARATAAAIERNYFGVEPPPVHHQQKRN